MSRSKLSALFNDDGAGAGGGLFGEVAADDGDDPFRYSRPRDPFAKPKPKPKPKPAPAPAPAPAAGAGSGAAGADGAPLEQKMAYVMQLTVRGLFRLDHTTRQFVAAAQGPVGCVAYGASRVVRAGCVWPRSTAAGLCVWLLLGGHTTHAWQRFARCCRRACQVHGHVLRRQQTNAARIRHHLIGTYRGCGHGSSRGSLW